MLSQVGSQATTVVLPLLVLSLSGSAAQAGLVGFARALALPLTALPAGVVADRCDRRRMLLVCAVGRGAAIGSVALALALGHPRLLQLLVVAFVDGVLFSAALIAERGLLAQIVAPEAMPDAVTLNEGRSAAASIVGPPAGGALFGIMRALPFAADAVSFAVTFVSTLAIRFRPPRSAAAPAPRSARDLRTLRAEVREGAAWLWSHPFLRAGALLYAAANLTLSAVELLGVLIARHHGASSAAIGLAYALVGAGGVISAVVAGPLRRRLSQRAGVLAEPWFYVVFTPLLLLAHSALIVGLVIGTMFLPVILSSSIIGGQRLTRTPDELRGRVQASASFISSSIAWAGPLSIGALFQYAGESAAILSLLAWTVVVAVAATGSSGLRAGAG
jgi:MFS family permease